MVEAYNKVKGGAHPEKALSAVFVRSVKEPGKYFVGHGLILRVDKSGAKRWVQRIVVNGKRTEIGLGSVSLMSLAEAREVALGNRKVAHGRADIRCRIHGGTGRPDLR